MAATESDDLAQRIELTPYQQIGGEDAVRRLADRFYEIMDGDPAAAGIRAMHASVPRPDPRASV
jgi:hemoglobin